MYKENTMYNTVYKENEESLDVLDPDLDDEYDTSWEDEIYDD